MTLAVFAWLLAGWVGDSWAQNTTLGKWLFLPLFVISGMGVYNTLMLVGEGQQVLIDTSNRVDEQFAALRAAAGSAPAASQAASRLDRVKALRDSLFSEIKNPLNCGQGPEARRLVASLQQELPGFTPLSAGHTDCARNADVIADYRQRIDDLIGQVKWPGADLLALAADADATRRSIAAIRGEATSGYNPGIVRHIVTEFEEQDAIYRNLRDRLGSSMDVKNLSAGLDLAPAQALGNPTKLPSLLFSRLDRPSTYVYLGLAALVDGLMCFLSYMNAKTRIGFRPRTLAPVMGDF